MTDTTTKWPTIPGGMPPFFDHPDRACAGKDPNLWFPEGGSNGAKAIAVCRDCPLIGTCADWALQQPRLYGVWGGLNAAERDRMRRRRPPHTIRGSWARTAADRARVAELVALGATSAEIGKKVGITTRTVRRHLNALGRRQVAA